MRRSVVMEEFHLTVFVPRDLPEKESRAARRTLISTRFRGRLHSAIVQVLRLHPSLDKARAVLSR